MLTQGQKDAIVQAIHSIDSLKGVAIGFYSNSTAACDILDVGSNDQSNYWTRGVIVEELATRAGEDSSVRIVDSAGNSNVVLLQNHESRSSTRSEPMTAIQEDSPEDLRNRSQISREFVGAGLSCAMAVFSGMEIAGGVAAEPVTGGLSTALVILGWTSFASSSISCINSIIRVAEATTNPDEATLDSWDHDEEFGYYRFLVDLNNVIGAAAGLAEIGVRYQLYVRALEQYSARFNLRELSQMTRRDRARRLAEAVQEAKQTSAGRAALRRARAEARATRADLRGAIRGRDQAGTYRVASALGNRLVLRQVFTVSEANALKKSIGTFMAQLFLSALPPEYVGSASGIGDLIIHVFELEGSGDHR